MNIDAKVVQYSLIIFPAGVIITLILILIINLVYYLCWDPANHRVGLNIISNDCACPDDCALAYCYAMGDCRPESYPRSVLYLNRPLFSRVVF